MPAPPNTPAITVQYLWQAAQARLSSARFWTDDELRTYAVEAVRTWNALSQFNTKKVALTVPAAGDQIRDLSVDLPSDLGYLYTDEDLATFCQYHLLEPVSYPAWTGSIQFTMADVLTAVARRRDQFLLETCCSLAVYTNPDGPDETGPVPPSGRLMFKKSVLAVRRVDWTDAETGETDRLYRSDEFSAMSFQPSWTNTPGLPKVYSVAVSPTFQLQLIPGPANPGSARLVVIPAGDQPDTDNPTPVLVNVPPDWAWVVKWGALADLLSKDGPVRDPDRAAYCQTRYELGVRAAKVSTSVLTAYLFDLPVPLSSFFSFDSFRAGWQDATGEPTAAALEGMNILALDKTSPDAVGLALDIVANTPLPAVGSAAVDTIEVLVGRDVADCLVGYIEHLAAFKMAGAEFMATQSAFKAMMDLAALYNRRMAAEAIYADQLLDRPRQEQRFVPDQSSQEVGQQLAVQ